MGSWTQRLASSLRELIDRPVHQRGSAPKQIAKQDQRYSLRKSATWCSWTGKASIDETRWTGKLKLMTTGLPINPV